MRHRTFPKENQKKLNKIISELRAILRSRDKEIAFLRRELENLVKPIRDRKIHIEKDKLDTDEWRKDFIKRYRKEVLGEKS